jgi:hypothetical protein
VHLHGPVPNLNAGLSPLSIRQDLPRSESRARNSYSSMFVIRFGQGRAVRI